MQPLANKLSKQDTKGQRATTIQKLKLIKAGNTVDEDSFSDVANPKLA